MAERESDQPKVFGKEPADDFPAESNLPVSIADVHKTRRVLQGGQVVLITLNSADLAKNEFLSEGDSPGREPGPILEIVPVERVRDASVADTLTGSSAEARAATRFEWVSTAFTAWQEVSSIGRISIGLAVAALGGVIYAALPGYLAGVDTAPRIVADAVISRETATTAAQDGTASRGSASDPSHADANSRDASEFARLNSDPVPRLLASEVSARSEGVTTGGDRRSAVTEVVAQKPSEQPQEVLVSQLQTAPDPPVVAGTLPAPAPAAPPEPADEAVRPTDAVNTSTTPVPRVAELATARAANERFDEVPPVPPPAGDTGRNAPPAPPAENVVVQAVLTRYARAYERLDATAVKNIWPTVDERALARAFNDLAAQSIVFDACDLTIAGTRATASCRGTATYSTSVGKRNDVMQMRQWTFLLERSPERWEIQQVQVR